LQSCRGSHARNAGTQDRDVNHGRRSSTRTEKIVRVSNRTNRNKVTATIGVRTARPEELRPGQFKTFAILAGEELIGLGVV